MKDYIYKPKYLIRINEKIKENQKSIWQKIKDSFSKSIK